MGNYFRALFYFFTGRWTAAGEAWQSNRYVMSTTYDKAIQKRAERYETVKSAVANLVGIEQTLTLEIVELGKKVEHLNKVKAGAQVAMQKTIDKLRAEGKSKEEIMSDTDFIKHKSAFEDASSTLKETAARMDDKEADLKERQKQIGIYEAELLQMQRQQKALQEEKHEAIADVAIAQDQEAVDSDLAGVPDDTVEKDLAKAREARNKAKARAKISSRLAGNDATQAENEYLNFASSKESDAELDGLLSWGEEATSEEKTAEELKPAQLPE